MAISIGRCCSFRAHKLSIQIFLEGQVIEGRFYVGPEEGLLHVLIQISAMCAIVPFVEEILFRGFLQRLLAEKYGVNWGYLGSTSVFAMGHSFSVDSVINSLILCAVYDKNKKIGSCIFAHSALNASWYVGLLLTDMYR
jgi:membrane protease YdiL (CAAX protease family)